MTAAIVNPLVEAAKSVQGVEKVSEWKDRHYVNLAASYGSRANGDLRTKLWIKGDVLTIEIGKGYTSDEFRAQMHALEAAVAQAGGTVRRV